MVLWAPITSPAWGTNMGQDFEIIARAQGWYVGPDHVNSKGADAIMHRDPLYNDSTFELGAWETVCRECGYID